MKPGVLLTALAALLCVVLPAHAAPLRITHVNVIDGTSRPLVEDTSILIRGGRIADISTTPPQPDEVELDARGAYALPGLIDAHTHLASVPGAAYRNDSAETRACLWKYHMHAYVAAGVTTVLDNAASPAAARRLHAYAAEGGARPRAYYLAPMLTPPGGYFSDAPMRGDAYAELWSPVADRADVVAHLEQAAALEPVGVKVAIEDGFGPLAVWETFSAEMRAAISEEARQRGRPLFIHSMSNEAHRQALAMQPRALVHSVFEHGEPAPDVVQAMRAQGVYVVSTIGIYDFPQIQWRQADLDDPLVRLTVPPVEIATARDAAAWTAQNETIAINNVPGWVPDFLVRWGVRWIDGQALLADYLDTAKHNLKQLHDAGVPIVLGSDSGNWPVFLTAFHGPQTLRELELIVEAGIPPLEALRAATQRAAEMIGVADELGTLAPGKRADVLLVPTNPLEDVRALRRPDWVIQDGIARRPREWMAGAPRCL